MVQTASTSEADQPHVPGATAVQVLGVLILLQGGYRLYAVTSTVVLLAQRGIYPINVFQTLFLSGVLGLLTIVAGVLLVRLDRAGRIFGLVVCSVVLAHQVLTFGSTLVALKLLTSSPAQSPGPLFWTLPPVNIVLFLVGIIVIARWHPPQLPDYGASTSILR
jgi:hypothetical protein